MKCGPKLTAEACLWTQLTRAPQDSFVHKHSRLIIENIPLILKVNFKFHFNLTGKANFVHRIIVNTRRSKQLSDSSLYEIFLVLFTFGAFFLLQLYASGDVSTFVICLNLQFVCYHVRIPRCRFIDVVIDILLLHYKVSIKFCGSRTKQLYRYLYIWFSRILKYIALSFTM